MQSFDAAARNQSIVVFLITRGPVAFLGSGWESGNGNFDEAFLYQVGEPVAECAETASGVFLREWTYGVVRFDCNNFQADVPTRAR